MLRRFFRLLFVKIPVGFVILSLSWVLLYKVVPVKWTPLMLKRTIENIGEKGYRNQRTWVDLDEIAPVMVRAVIGLQKESSSCLRRLSGLTESQRIYDVTMDRSSYPRRSRNGAKATI